MLNAPGKHCKNRLFEWAMTAALLGMGIVQVAFPQSVAQSKFQFMLEVVGAGSLTAFCIVVGSLRAVALYLNGSWPVWGARVRMIAAIGSATVWMQMGLSLTYMQIIAGAPPSPSSPLLFALVFAELYSTYRAGADAGYR